MANKAKTQSETEPRRGVPTKDLGALRADSHEPVRLRHLCKEDKAKIGELLQVMVTERSRSKECLRRYATDMKEYQDTMRRLKKQNRRLSKERETLQQQLQQSMMMLAQCKGSGGKTGDGKAGEGDCKGKNSEMLQTSELGETFGTSRFRPGNRDEEAQTCLPDCSKENSARPSAVGEVKSLRQDLANLSLSLRQLNGSAMEGRSALAPLQLNDSAFNPSALQSKRTSSRNSTRKNPLLLDSSTNEGRPSERREFSPRPNPVATPSTLPSTSFLHSPRLCQYDDSLFDLLEELESGSIAQPTPKHRLPSSPDSDLAYSLASSLYSARKVL